MNMVSDCCSKEIIHTTKHHYPLGGSVWYESFKVIVCSGCGGECDEIHACDQCGEPGVLERIDGDDCCPTCAAEMRRLNPEEVSA